MTFPDFTAALETALNEILDGETSVDTYTFVAAFDRKEGAMCAVIKSALKAAETEGLIKPCPNGTYHEMWGVDYWNQMADKGISSLEDWELDVIVRVLTSHLSSHAHIWARDPNGKGRAAHPEMPVSAAAIMERVSPVDRISAAEIPTLAAILNAQLQSPSTLRFERDVLDWPSNFDYSTIQYLFDGWTPYVASKSPNGPLTKVSAIDHLPAVRHYELPTSGKMVLFSSRDGVKVLVKKLHELECKVLGLPHDFSCNFGANNHALSVYAASGILPVHMGDHFPIPYKEGKMIRGMTSLDYVPTHECFTLQNHSLDDPVFADWNDLVAFLGDEQILVDAEASGDILVYETDPGTLHLYTPDGWRADDFAEHINGPQRPACLTDVQEEFTYFLLSPEEIPFEEKEITHAEMPARTF